MNTDVNKKVLKDLEKVPKNVKEEVLENIQTLEEAEHLFQLKNVSHMEGTDEPYYRLKLGTYRLLVYYEKETKSVTVHALTHR